MTVLIVSDPRRDIHLPPVVSELQRRGYGVFIFDPGGLPAASKITVEATRDHVRRELHAGNATLDLDRVSCAWFRKPSRYDIPHSLEVAEQDWLRLECRHLVRSLWQNTEAFWVSDPGAIQQASYKLIQLKAARELGFDIPSYIVTNREDDARAFVEAHPAGAIVKALGRPTIESFDAPGMIYTHRLTAEDIEQLGTVDFGPTFLQEFVEKKYDIRVSVFGERLFAVAIDATDAPGGVVDFRRADAFKIPHEPIELPEPLTRACIDLVARLGLRFGAIDLLQTSNGDFVFLEINPNGQWLWMELITGLPMSVALCDLLESGVPESERPDRPRLATTGKSIAPEKTELQIGEQQFALPESIRSWLDESEEHTTEQLAGTNVLFEETRGAVSLHVGDIEQEAE